MPEHPVTQSQPTSQGSHRRRAQLALGGMLVVVLVLGGALVVTAVASYRAATRAAQAVLHSRAVEVATGVGAAVRLAQDQSPEELGRLIQPFGGEGVDVAILEHRGRVLAATAGLQGKSGTAQRWPIPPRVRTEGRSHDFVADASGREPHMDYWQAVPRGRGRGWHQGPGGRWLRRGGPLGPLRRWGPARPFPPPKGRPWRPRHGRRFFVVRIMVDQSVAQSVVAPARYGLLLAGSVAGLLMVLAVAMYRVARRARLVEQELDRRRALSALGEMAAVLAHEIRTPLGSIKGNAQLVGEQLPDDDRVAAMVRESARLERLVNGMLDYARPAPPTPRPCDPDDVAAQAAQVVAPKAEAAGVMLMTDPDGAGRPARLDRDQMVQVLVNLLQNAVEASAKAPAEQRTVVLRVRRGRRDLLFTVLDRGSGLGGATVDQLTKPFVSGRHGGTGLGLAVARQIAAQHGGQLTIRDRKQGGVRAEVALPLEEGATV